MGTSQRGAAGFRSGGGRSQGAQGRCRRSSRRCGVFTSSSSSSCFPASPLPGSASPHAHTEPSSPLATTQPEQLPPAPPPPKLSGQLRLRGAAPGWGSPGSSQAEAGLVSWAGRGGRGEGPRRSLPLPPSPAPPVPPAPLLQPPQCTIPPGTPPTLPQPPTPRSPAPTR